MKKQTPTDNYINFELDEYEQELEDNLELCNRLNSSDEKLEIEKLVTAARNHLSAKKSITIRIAASDLEVMRLKASKLGIPYQTYINMVIHKDASIF